MKSGLLSVVCFILLTCVSFAQDVIVTKDAKIINAKVTEVNLDNIRYKNFDNQDGPVYTLLKNDIASIVYQNGQVESFAVETPRKTTSRKPSPEYFSCVGKPPVELIAEMEFNNYDLYRKYMSGKKMARNGGTLIGVGGMLTFLGIISTILVDEVENQEAIALLGFTSLVGGPICLTAGIPVFIVGKNRKKGAVRDYCQQQYMTTSSMPHFQINLYSNRVGLAFVF